MKILKKGLSIVLVALLIFSMSTISFASSSKTEKPDTPPVPVRDIEGTVPVTGGEKKTETEAKAKATVKEAGAFDFKTEDVVAVYKSKSGSFALSPIPEANDFVATLNTLEGNADVKKFTWDFDEAAAFTEGSFMVVFKNGVRRVYALNKDNRIQAGDDFYTVTADAYGKLLSLYNTDFKRASFAQWLIYMRPASITNIYLEDGTGKKAVAEGALSSTTMLVRSLRVTGGTSYSPVKADFTPGNGKVRVTIEFGEKATYTLMFEGNNLYLEASELKIGCSYTISPADKAALIAAFS